MASDKTEIGNRMKYYEGFETRRRLMPLNPAVCRLDGKNFHNFCRGLERPYDERLSSLMCDLTTFLAKEFCAVAAYTQSDEITLVWNQERFDSEIFCDGKIQKMNSLLAARTSVKFNSLLSQYIPEKVSMEPIFDCRIFSLPNTTEAANVFLWREIDAARNSVQMAGRAYFSHNEVQDKNGSEIQEMLFSKKNINWNDYPAFFRRGRYILRRIKKGILKFEEIETLPLKHHARSNPELVCERNVYEEVHLPPLRKIVNRERVLFYNEEPKTKE
jgi:tRNA(His) 5'-end guanylyltransferase